MAFIETTYNKAKYMVPLAELVIHKAKKGGKIADHYMKKIFYDKEAGRKCVRELAPRFRYFPKILHFLYSNYSLSKIPYLFPEIETETEAR